MRTQRLLLLIALLLFTFSAFTQPETSFRQKTLSDVSLQTAEKSIVHFDSLTKGMIQSFPKKELPEQRNNISVTEATFSNNFTPPGSINFHLVQDLNAQANANPSEYTILNNVLYFSAYDGIYGYELWRSDGTAGGTYLVKDINTGQGSSSPYEMVVSNGKLFFRAYNGINYGLWMSDGTANGTRLVKTFSGTYDASPYMLCDVEGTLYFSVSSKGYSDQLWKSDGTPDGTVLVKDISTNGGGKISNTVSAADFLFFVAYTPTSGYEVWRSDGTGTGTFIVKDICTSTSSTDNSPAQLTAYNGKLYFSQRKGADIIRRLYETDGTAGGTIEVAGNYPGLSSYVVFTENSPFTISNNSLCFNAYVSGSSLSQIYRYNPNASANPVLIASYTPQIVLYTGYSQSMGDVNGALYYVYSDTLGSHLSKVDSNSTSSTDITYIDTLVYADRFFDLNGKLFFRGQTPAQGFELWTSDGTDTGTHIANDIYTGGTSSFPSYFTLYKSSLLFAAADRLHGRELMMYDSAGTRLIKDINTIFTASSYPYPIIPFGEDVLMNAGNYETGDELWKSNGDTITLVKDVRHGEFGGSPVNFTVKNKTAYFLAYEADFITSVYQTDGTEAGTKRISHNTTSISDYTITDDGSLFYTTGTSGSYGSLYKLNPVDSSEMLLQNNLSFHGVANVYGDTKFLTTAGSGVYFDASQYPYGYELWKSDGTVEGTQLVKDIYPGGSSSSSDPALKIMYHGNLYFVANDGSEYALWKSDGTSVGTVKVKSVKPLSFYITNNILFFNGYTAIEGEELWKTDGTVSGTVLVKDINTGTVSSTPSRYSSLNNVLYFVATDATHGSELWRSDGTTNGTYFVKDIIEGTGSSSPAYLTIAASKLFFTVNSKIWISDGTSTGTGPIDDAVTDNANAYYLTGNGNKLFYEGYSNQYGYELYEGDASLAVLPVTLISFNAYLKRSDVVIHWQTASEINTSYFNIQRSIDGIHFTDAGKVTAKGGGNSYSFSDINIANLVSAKTIYYRMQIVDKDGSSSVSKVIPVNLKLTDAVVLLLPNPVKDVLKIRINNYSGEASLSVYDGNGKAIYSSQHVIQNSNDISVPASHMQSGVYLLKIALKGKIIQQKFIKE